MRRFLLLMALVVQPVGLSLSAQSAPALTVAEWRAKVDSLRLSGDQSQKLAEAWRGLADAHGRDGQVDSSLAAFRQAAKVVQSFPDSKLKGDILSSTGSMLLRANQNDSALVYVARAREMRLKLGDTIGALRTWNNTGSGHYQLGHYEQALTAFVQALDGRRLENDTVGMARVLTNIGKVYQDWGQYDRAESRLQEAIRFARLANNPGILGYALNTLAQVYIDRGEYDLAYRTIDASLVAYSSKDPLVSSSDSLGGWRLNALARADALVRQGRAAQALPYLDSVVAVGQMNGNIRSIAKSQMLRGQAYAQLGDLARARTLLTESFALSKSVEQRVFMLTALERLSDVEEKAGDAMASLRALRSATALRDTIFNQATAERLAAEERREERERELQENAALRQAQREQAQVIERQRITVSLVLVILLLGALLLFLMVRYNRLGKAREQALAKTNDELRMALADVRTLSGLIPICASCKRVRDDRGYWQAVESYISNHSDAKFSHAICQSCGPELYGDIWPGTQPTAQLSAPPATDNATG